MKQSTDFPDRTHELRETFATFRREPEFIEWLPVVDQLEAITMEMYALLVAIDQRQEAQASQPSCECFRAIQQAFDLKLSRLVIAEVEKLLAIAPDVFRGPLCECCMSLLPIIEEWGTLQQLNALCAASPTAATFFATQPEKPKHQ
ncbi:MAG TPA: hypothetical protein VK530_04210 [Candidatus Acidoferrum sp.]|nr:hypothetical protein [Candidatus Acidoferrum sp.]